MSVSLPEARVVTVDRLVADALDYEWNENLRMLAVAKREDEAARNTDFSLITPAPSTVSPATTKKPKL